MSAVRTVRRGFVVLGTTGLLSLGVTMAACADDADEAHEAPDAADDAGDGNRVIGEQDSRAPVGDQDASADADGEAAAPTCSFDGFCYTALPAGTILRGVWGDGLGVVWAVSQQGSILRWGGTSWTVVHSSAGALFTIWGSGPTDVWAGGEGRLLHGTGASSSTLVWNVEVLPGDPTLPIRSLWGTGPNDLWAVGGTAQMPRIGQALHYAGSPDAGGTGWVVDPISLVRPLTFIAVWGTGPNDVWLGADKGSRSAAVGTVLRSNRTGSADGGPPTWDTIPLPVEQFGSPLSILTTGGAVTPDDVWVFGRTTLSQPSSWRGTRGDGGVFEWTRQITKHSDSFDWAVYGVSRTDAWSVGEYGRLRHWDGSTFTQARITLTSEPFIRTFFGAWGDGKGELWVVGDGVALHKPAVKGP